jgi:hypothetical protein
MTYDGLTSAQRAQVQVFLEALRPTMGELARLFARFERLEDAWSGSVAGIVTGLDAGAVITDDTGLAGAQHVTRESLVGTMADFSQALAAFNSDGNRARYIAYAGLPNTL